MILVQLQIWVLYGLLGFLPFLTLYVATEPFAVSSVNIGSVLFIILGIVNILTGQLKLSPVNPKSLRIAMGLFLVALIWALFFTHPLMNAFGIWTSRLLQPLLVGYGVYLLVKPGHLTLTNLLRALLVSFIPLTLYGLLQFFGVVPFLDAHRVSGVYASANDLARFASFVMLLGLPLVFRPNSWLDRGLWLLGLVLIGLTQSYGGSLALWAGLLAAVLMLPASYRKTRLTGLSLLTLAIIGVTLFGPQLPKWEQTITYSIATRLEFWRVALGIMGDHFWTGIGLKGWESNYVDLVRMYGPGNPLNYASSQPHNVYLDSFMKAGLPGFIGIIGLLIWAAGYGWQVLRQNVARASRGQTADFWLGIGLFSYGIGLLVFGLIDDPIWSDDAMLLLMVSYFGIAAATSPKKQA